MMEANRGFIVILLFLPALVVVTIKVLTRPLPFDITNIDYFLGSVIFIIIYFAQVKIISILKKETKIYDDLYYSPGFFKSRTELKIDKNGLSIVLWNILPDRKTDTSTNDFETITFENIRSVKGLHKNIVSKKHHGIKFITHLEITTKDDKIGYISFSSHIRKEVLGLLKKFIGPKWDEIYTEVW